MKAGPVTRQQMARLASHWKQGEHMLISGGTGSGKTLLARYVDEIRIQKGGHVVVLVCKLKEDNTLTEYYGGFTRWKKWKKNPSRSENKVLLWPDTSKAKTIREAKRIQKEAFQECLDHLSQVGKWNLHVDEGLYLCSPRYLGMDEELGMLHALGRSSGLTITTLVQRPSHIPVIIYPSASNAMIGRTRETSDLKRLSELGSKTSARERARMISSLDRHDFLWLPVSQDGDPEIVNISR